MLEVFWFLGGVAALVAVILAIHFRHSLRENLKVIGGIPLALWLLLGVIAAVSDLADRTSFSLSDLIPRSDSVTVYSIRCGGTLYPEPVKEVIARGGAVEITCFDDTKRYTTEVCDWQPVRISREEQEQLSKPEGSK